MATSADAARGVPLTASHDEPPPIWFLVPEGFFALPLAVTPEERTERAHSFVRELYSRGCEEVWEPAAPYYAGIAELMAGTGISYAAMGLFSTAAGEDDADRTMSRHELARGAAQCSFTVAAVPTDQSANDTDVVAQGILAVLSGDQYNDARWLDLPCGPAVSCVMLRKYSLAPETTADGAASDLLTGQIQVHVPFPTGPFIAVFTLFTASMDYWSEFCDLLAAVLRTVSFADPGASSVDGSVRGISGRRSP
ncbi:MULTISPECIES: hypothetical protein [unclassified Streptomyces]|uniref:hypothetical protein n=1 Tax=unclassified Streptomyces TaxID=2593676 RepID=UPI0033B0173B